MESKVYQLLADLKAENEKRQAEICKEEDYTGQRIRKIYTFNDTLEIIKRLETALMK